MSDALDTQRWQRAAEVFDELRPLAPAERAARLSDLASEDPELGAEVGGLLEAADSEGLLDTPAMESLATLLAGEAEADAADAIGRRIGPYRIVEELGRGGMGVVYLAERADGQFEQQVAIKLVKRGLDTDEVLARFRRERQILARLDHRAIGRLFDGGATEDGRPYFVMEHVVGEPITAYCDARRLSIDERLRLFRRVCEAVHHAHRNLVVHRDLKPSNVLVTQDRDLKLLDFGLAKLLSAESEGPEARTLTRTGPIALTPEYAAPEQVAGGAVSTATDVYSLGVVLYELLTGRRPYQLGRRFGPEAERTILEVEPPAPSAVVEEPPEREEAAPEEGDAQREEVTAASLAAARGLTPAALRRRLAGDLDAIVLTALRKEPERRYGSAQALGEDLAHHLAGQPVAARPEGRLYRARKFARRHRVGVAAALAVLVALIGGLATTTWQARVARRQAARAEEVKAFLIGLFEGSDPGLTTGPEVTARQLLDQGAARIREELADDPALRAELLVVLAGMYEELNVFEGGLKLAEEAVAILRGRGGRDASLLADALETQAVLLRNTERPAEAEPLLREALALRQRQAGEEDAGTGRTWRLLAQVLGSEARYDEARELYQQALAIQRRALGDRHPDVATTSNYLGLMEREAGDLEAAERAIREALEIRREALGPDHPDTTAVMNNLALLQGGEAETLYLQAIAALEAKFPDGHRNLGTALIGWGRLLEKRTRAEEAEAVLRRALAMLERTEGTESWRPAEAKAALGSLLTREGRAGEAAPLLRDALAAHGRRFGSGSWQEAEVQVRLAECLAAEGRSAEARELVEPARRTLVAKRGLAYTSSRAAADLAARLGPGGPQ